MAEQLIEAMVTPWDPEAYRDEYRDDLLRVIEEKERTGRVEEVAVAEGAGAPAEGQVVDIMALLKRSVDEVRGAGEREGGAGDGGEAAAAGAEEGVAEARRQGRAPQGGLTRPHGARRLPGKTPPLRDARTRPAARVESTRRSVRRAQARRSTAALRPAARARRRAQELGGAQGTEPRPRRQAPRRARRGPPARVRRLRGRHPQGPVRRRHRHGLGPRPLVPRRGDRRRPAGAPTRPAI